MIIMKRKLLVCMVGLACFLGVNAQITLEHVFDISSNFGMEEERRDWMTNYSFISETYGLVFVIYNDANHALDLYKSDYSFFKSIPLEPFFPKSLFMWIHLDIISEKLFDPDEAFEFLISFEVGPNRALKLCKENGTEIKDFGDAWASILYDCNAYKLAVENNGDGRIYSLPGTLPTCNGNSGIRSSNAESNGFMAYPNPTKRDLNIPYSLDAEENATLNIYTQSGALREQRTINGTGTARINVSRYAPGVYIYQYNDVSGQFIVR